MTTYKPNTHLEINHDLSGTPVEINETGSRVSFIATQDMAADDKGLVHGGFVFSLADYTAMVAINDPNVVLGKADVKFLKPVKVGDELEAVAEKLPEDGRKLPVKVNVMRGDDTVFVGEFICMITPKHVLDL